MSNWSGSEDKQSLAAMQLSCDLGCNFYDTAWAYGDGKSDGFLGELIHKNPKRGLFAASKVPPKNRKWPAAAGDRYDAVFPADHVRDYANRIRRELGIEAIDLLQFHVWDDGWTDAPEFRNTVEQLKRDGVIRWFGLSLNRHEPWNGLRALRTGLVDAVQVVYNIFDQAPEDELLPACRELKIGVIARVPFDEGGLTGKLRADTRFPPNDFRATYFSGDKLAATVERAERIAKLLPVGMPLAEAAIRFILSNRDVSTTIPGMRTSEHVRANIRYADAGPLPAELLAELKGHRWDRKVKAT